MVVTLTGIVDDGSRRSPAVPRVLRKQIDVVRGTDFTIRLKLRYPSNRPVDLSAGTPVTTLRVLTSPDGDALVTLTGVVEAPAEDGITVFSGVPADTSDLSLRRYLYDVRHVQDDVTHSIIPASPFVVTA